MATRIEHGKKYKVREKGANYYEVVSVDQVTSRGVVTITIGGFLGQGGRLDLTPKRVAQLEWQEVGQA